MPKKPSGSLIELDALLSEMLALRAQVVKRAKQRLKGYRKYYPDGDYSKSARNLAHYLALRQVDLRQLQERLAKAGLSSLGRAESGVLANLDSVTRLLRLALGKSPHKHKPQDSDDTSPLDKHTAKLFGPIEGERQVRIMVTLPSEAARDYELVRELLLAGTNCVRINCAHDDPAAWEGMIRHVRQAAEETRRHCRILMDLAGHKMRTGPLAEGPRVLHCKVRRNTYGQPVAPSEVTIRPASAPPADAKQKPGLRVPDEIFSLFAAGDQLLFTDSRGKPRSLELIRPLSVDCWLAHCGKPAYLAHGALARLCRPEPQLGPEFNLEVDTASQVDIRLRKGDALLLSCSGEAGVPAVLDADGNPLSPARIGCGVPEITQWLQPGDPVWLDDGKIGAVMEQSSGGGALLRIVQAKPNGTRLLSDKGINLPKTPLQLPPLSEKDLRDLDFVCRHADMVGFSFVESLQDMEYLMEQLALRKAKDLPIVAKIESARAVRNLPEIILGSIGRHQLGVMIARGDLAVELGCVRLAEIQEELLWVCEAAHVPVIWATQVLESMAQKNQASRPELTDAAMSVRAECVMLNKGPYIAHAVEVLDDVLSCMQAHQHKKFSRLRALHW